MTHFKCSAGARLPVFSLLLALSAVSRPSMAQSMMVIGGNADAEGCYRAAGLAAQFGHAESADLDMCDRAIEYTALDLNDRLATFVNRGILHGSRENYTAAVADYRRAENINPKNAAVAVNLGNLWYVSGYFEQAVERYAFALEHSSNHRDVAYYNRGMAREKTGELALAIGDYQAALKISPDWERVQKRLEKAQKKFSRKNSE